MITKLTVVGACLASMGEAAPNSLDESNPFIQSALLALNYCSPSEQSRGWYFNMEHIKVVPTTDQEYFVPGDVLGLVPKMSPNHIVIRGRRLYDTARGEPYTGTKPIRVSVIRNIPFEDLPFHAQRVVQAATVMYFQESYDGDPVKIDQARQEYAMAIQHLNAEHTRSVNVNMLQQGHVGASRLHNTFVTGRLPEWR